MAVRFLVVMIDDTRPLGPQLKAARVFGGQPLKILAALSGISVRHVQNLMASARFCERQTVRRGITLASDEVDPTGQDHVR